MVGPEHAFALGEGGLKKGDRLVEASAASDSSPTSSTTRSSLTSSRSSHLPKQPTTRSRSGARKPRCSATRSDGRDFTQYHDIVDGIECRPRTSATPSASWFASSSTREFRSPTSAPCCLPVCFASCPASPHPPAPSATLLPPPTPPCRCLAGSPTTPGTTRHPTRPTCSTRCRAATPNPLSRLLPPWSPTPKSPTPLRGHRVGVRESLEFPTDRRTCAQVLSRARGLTLGRDPHFDVVRRCALGLETHVRPSRLPCLRIRRQRVRLCHRTLDSHRRGRVRTSGGSVTTGWLVRVLDHRNTARARDPRRRERRQLCP